MNLKELNSVTFSSELIEEGSWGSRPIGFMESTMVLYRDLESPGHWYIEWDIPVLEETITIGIWTDEDVLADYDGIMGDLPTQVIDLLRHEGVQIPPEFLHEGEGESCH